MFPQPRHRSLLLGKCSNYIYGSRIAATIWYTSCIFFVIFSLFWCAPTFLPNKMDLYAAFPGFYKIKIVIVTREHADTQRYHPYPHPLTAKHQSICYKIYILNHWCSLEPIDFMSFWTITQAWVQSRVNLSLHAGSHFMTSFIARTVWC